MKAQVILENPPTDVELRYEVTGGYIVGSGTAVEWHMEGLSVGTYKITVSEYVNNTPRSAAYQATVKVVYGDCEGFYECPYLKVSGPTKEVKNHEVTYFSADVRGGTIDVTYLWTVQNAEIISGQGTPNIEVRVKRTDAKYVKATVEIGGIEGGHGCPTTESAAAYIID